MKLKLFMVAAVVTVMGSASVSACTTDNDTTVQKKETLIDKTKKEVKKDAKVVKDGTEKTWEKTKKGTEKAYDKTKAGTVKAWDKTKKGTVETYDKAKDGTVKVWEKVKKGTEKAYDKTKDALKKNQTSDVTEPLPLNKSAFQFADLFVFMVCSVQYFIL